MIRTAVFFAPSLTHTGLMSTMRDADHFHASGAKARLFSNIVHFARRNGTEAVQTVVQTQFIGSIQGIPTTPAQCVEICLPRNTEHCRSKFHPKLAVSFMGSDGDRV